jgi:hypothetical protein
MLTGDERRVAREIGALAVKVGDDPPHLLVADVIAEHEPLEPAEVLEAAPRRAQVRLALHGRERDAVARRSGRRLVAERLEPQERRLGGHLHVRTGQDLAHTTAERRRQRRLHLHALHDGHDVARLDLVARGHGDGDHDGGGEVADEPAVVARDPVRNAVDLDEQIGALERGERPVRLAAQLESSLVGANTVDGHLDRRAVHGDTVPAGTELGDREAVALTPVTEVDRADRARAGLGPTAARERVEARAVGGGLGLAQLDRRLHQRDVGVPHGDDVTAQLHPVEPGRVDLARAHLGPVEQIEQEPLVRRPAVDYHHRLGERAA